VKASCPRAYRHEYAAFVLVGSRHSGAICTVLIVLQSSIPFSIPFNLLASPSSIPFTNFCLWGDREGLGMVYLPSLRRKRRLLFSIERRC
jgi:hypothetical protein